MSFIHLYSETVLFPFIRFVSCRSSSLNENTTTILSPTFSHGHSCSGPLLFRRGIPGRHCDLDDVWPG